jgi:replication-associated recombination protein RarA
LLSILEREIILSYQVLARKWRPKNFNDVKGQDHITRTLVNSIKNQKIAHAYLLTGTRGIGKTTIARIFAEQFVVKIFQLKEILVLNVTHVYQLNQVTL